MQDLTENCVKNKCFVYFFITFSRKYASFIILLYSKVHIQICGFRQDAEEGEK